MARIPEGEVERLKREVSVERLAEARGIKLTRHGRTCRAVPVPRRPDAVAGHHSGEEPLALPGRVQRGRDGDRLGDAGRGVSFRHAVELLQRGISLSRRSECQAVKQSTVRKLPPPVDADGGRPRAAVAGRGLLPRDAEAVAGGAGVSGVARPEIAEMIDRFQLGFANRTLGYRLPAKNRAAGAEMRGRLQTAGHLPRERARALQRLAGDPGVRCEGEVVEMYGRKITPNLREGTPLTISICRGRTAGVWNEAALSASKEIILCEALIDALTFWVAGYPQRDGELRGERLHRGPSRGLREARHGAGLHRLRPRRGGRQSRREAGRGADGDGHRVLPGAVPEGHGRERVRAEGDASGEESGRAAEQGGVAGQGPAASSGGVWSQCRREPEPSQRAKPEPQ